MLGDIAHDTLRAYNLTVLDGHGRLDFDKGLCSIRSQDLAVDDLQSTAGLHRTAVCLVKWRRLLRCQEISELPA